MDYEAIGWAYMKLLAFGVQNTSMENAMFMDRLNMILMLEPDEPTGPKDETADQSPQVAMDGLPLVNSITEDGS
jgi:hypothetical protein